MFLTCRHAGSHHLPQPVKILRLLLLSLSLSLWGFFSPFHLGITCPRSNPNTAQSWLSATGPLDNPLSLLMSTLALDLFSGRPPVWGLVWTLPWSCANESGDK